MVELLTKQKKRYILLFNRVIRRELKKVLIQTPSKLTDDEINNIFDKLFDKKEWYYIPKKNIINIKLDEEEFKTLYKKPKDKPLTKAELKRKVELFYELEKKIKEVQLKLKKNPSTKKKEVLTETKNKLVDELLGLKLQRDDIDRYDSLFNK
jgi:hypothetical protein